jgi:erythrocyte band 7 integral membrane protein
MEMEELTEHGANRSALIETPNHAGAYENFLTSWGRFTGALGIMCCGWCSPYQVVEQGHCAAVLNFGKFDRQLGSGMHYVNPVSEKMVMVDLRLIVLDIDRQTMITHDNITIGVDCSLGYKIVDIRKAQFEVQDVQNVMIQFTYATLKDVIGTKTLQECLNDRAVIAKNIQDIVTGPAHEWGVRVESMRFKDIHTAMDIQTALSAAAIAQRNAESKLIGAKADAASRILNARADAEAKLINAEADVSAAKMMKLASECLSTESSMRLQKLKTLETIARFSQKAIFVPYDLSTATHTQALAAIQTVDQS